MNTLLVWLLSIMASSAVVFLTNEKYELMQFAHDVAVIIQIDPEKFIKLIDCESKFVKTAKGDFRSETKEFMARGILQFWKSTFITQSKIYDFKGDYLDPKDQIILAGKMLKEKDGWRHWTNCWKWINR